MYEMEGALPGLAAPGRPVTRPAQRRAPPAGAGDPRETPVSRLLPRPGGRPRMVPVPNGESISTASPAVAQESAAIHVKFFFIHTNVHRALRVIRTSRRLSTACAQPVHRLHNVISRVLIYRSLNVIGVRAGGPDRGHAQPGPQLPGSGRPVRRRPGTEGPSQVDAPRPGNLDLTTATGGRRDVRAR